MMENTRNQDHVESVGPTESQIPTFKNLPNKDQLFILALSRFVDFFQQAALQTFMVHQLQSFDPSLSQATIAYQAGILQGSFTAAQIITSIIWGRVADHPAFGRKTVLNIGLIGTGIGCAGLGFSSNFQQAVAWRLLTGAINGTVGSARTLVAECIPKPWHSRAFLFFPVAFNFANVAGPVFTSLLIYPYTNMSSLFGPHSLLGGDDGLTWMRQYPFALANLLSTALLFTEAVLVHSGLHETLKAKQPMNMVVFSPFQVARTCYKLLTTRFKMGDRHASSVVHQNEGLLANSDDHDENEVQSSHAKLDGVTPRMSFFQIWTPNLIWTLLSIAIFDFHLGAFANLWTLFLAGPRLSNADFVNEERSQGRNASLHWRTDVTRSSGLGFSPILIGNSMAILGFVGGALQLLLYPSVTQRFGLLRCFRWSLPLFPVAYFLTPFLSSIPSRDAPPASASGLLVWAGISSVLVLQVSARTFTMPAAIILLNNASPHPSVLGTVHGLGSADSAAFRTLGPMIAAYWYGVSVEKGIGQLAWWLVAVIAAIGCIISHRVRNGSGHEILLPEDIELEPPPALQRTRH
ncbi:MFS general substrate transporter [Dissoconium aciculare CBS 342.82]|uniref:MFS general substrate transporter n=1 Tax=Dissoconium aciculare CBS 342.82 TaxID=1314786 RepID=A0A6J3MBT8_9PEZI|nr:MFS general substrate transporter [Dissoconium aciculare CBS 342.82]KAF1825343.1 MFS general substrate transporter [Dissoconium aciculare CBS 342.82]